MTENDIRKRLAGRAAEYRMFMDDEPDIEAPATGAGSTIVSPELLKLKDDVGILYKATRKY